MSEEGKRTLVANLEFQRRNAERLKRLRDLHTKRVSFSDLFFSQSSLIFTVNIDGNFHFRTKLASSIYKR